MYYFKTVISLILAVLSLLPSKIGMPFGPSVIFDASELTGEVTSGASGYLYGIAEDGVPSYNMIESLDISSVSAKTQGGLQHPIGEVGDIAPSLTAYGKCDYIVVYLQDMYSTWYYDNNNINEMKKSGVYDWKSYLESTYFPMIEETVNAMKDEPYADKLVYCPFNECDNGVWFGEWITDGNDSSNGWNSFNEQGMKNFCEAWKMTAEYIKSLDENAVIGGPGNYEYSHDKTDAFLSYTSENGCTPDVIIYHELGDRSVYDWEANVKDLRALEGKYSVPGDTPIIVTEYGRMQDNGNPNTMLKHIAQIENSKVYANQAYWLLADNLCNTAADYNTPNSAWWVYRWYTNMSGETMKCEISDILHSDLEKALKGKREPRYTQLLGVGALSDGKDKIDILVSGTDYNSCVKVKNLKDTALYGEKVRVTVTSVTYQGIAGEVYAPEKVKSYTRKCGGNIAVTLEPDENTAYHIVIERDSESENIICGTPYDRYEFEDGTLLGNAYTYDSAYATTGAQEGMVGGMENDGDGVEISIKVPSGGDYDLRLIYGNSNDGVSPSDRTYSQVNFSVDGETDVLSFENTIKSELTSAYDLTLTLTKGRHTLKFEHKEGTIVLDSLLIRNSSSDNSVYAEKDGDRDSSYLAVAPSDGYYDIEMTSPGDISVDGAPAVTDENGKARVYLGRGLNFIDVPENAALSIRESDFSGEVLTLEPKDALLSGTAVLMKNEKMNTPYISGISSDGGEALYSVNAPESGVYKMTVLYSNNRENGVHDYNVDLVEDYITVSVNGEKTRNVYCRNTYSADTYKTVTVNITLKKGENMMAFSNDGSNRFNGSASFAPDISTVTVNPTSAG